MLTALFSWYLVKFFELACPTTNLNVQFLILCKYKSYLQIVFVT